MQIVTTRQTRSLAMAIGSVIVASGGCAVALAPSHEQSAHLQADTPRNMQLAHATANRNEDCSAWLRELVLDMQSIKPGTTRADLEAKFVSDGPTRTAKAHRYQHPKCPYLKLDVFFDVVGDKAAHQPSDKASKVQGPLIDLDSNWNRW